MKLSASKMYIYIYILFFTGKMQRMRLALGPSAEAAVSLWQLLGSGSLVGNHQLAGGKPSPSNLLRKKNPVSHHGGGGIDLLGLQHVFFC